VKGFMKKPGISLARTPLAKHHDLKPVNTVHMLVSRLEIFTFLGLLKLFVLWQSHISETVLVSSSRTNSMVCLPSQLDQNRLHIEISLPVREAGHF
jgi:hypothetical protein